MDVLEVKKKARKKNIFFIMEIPTAEVSRESSQKNKSQIDTNDQQDQDRNNVHNFEYCITGIKNAVVNGENQVQCDNLSEYHKKLLKEKGYNISNGIRKVMNPSGYVARLEPKTDVTWK